MIGSGRGSAGPIPEPVRAEMRGRSWRDDPRCPRFNDLALLAVPFRDFDGVVQVGELVVADDLAGQVLDVFVAIGAADFRIERMIRIDAFDADDDRSMAANNCSAFCFREISRGGGLSQHAFGRAIDINPVQNPYLVGDEVLPASGRAYMNRADLRPGMIVRPSPVIDAFSRIGWEWGGDWAKVRDYHHFVAPARV